MFLPSPQARRAQSGEGRRAGRPVGPGPGKLGMAAGSITRGVRGLNRTAASTPYKRLPCGHALVGGGASLEPCYTP